MVTHPKILSKHLIWAGNEILLQVLILNIIHINIFPNLACFLENKKTFLKLFPHLFEIRQAYCVLSVCPPVSTSREFC